MRRLLAIIMVSAALLAMHGGRWAAYAWCQVQASLVWQQQACDCAQLLADDDGSSQLADNNGALINLASEPFGTAAGDCTAALPKSNTVVGFSAHLSPIVCGIKNLVFRPPVACPFA